jgi:hypothetical protein
MTDAAGLEFDALDLGFDPDGLDLGDVLDGQAGGSAAPEPEPEPPAGYPDRPLDQRGRARVPSRGGRPTLYTLPRVLTILAALFNGATRADAARRAGVGVSTFYVWLQLGRQGHPMFAPLAEAVANVEIAQRFNMALGYVIRQRAFCKNFP